MTSERIGGPCVSARLDNPECTQPKHPTAGVERCLAPTPKQTPRKTLQVPPTPPCETFFSTFGLSVLTELRIASYYTNNTEPNAEKGFNIHCAVFTVFTSLSLWNWL